MLKNEIVNFSMKESFDSKLIVFLNYQGMFLVFSKSKIELYNSSLTKVHMYNEFSSSSLE